jgi:hypothetical protein
MFNTKIFSPTPEGREGEWKYGYTHSYHRYLTEVRGQPHAQPIYPRLKSRRHTLSGMLGEPHWRFSWIGNPLVPGGTRTQGHQMCSMCEGYGLGGATTCLLTLSALCSISSRKAFSDFFVYFKARSWYIRLQIHKDLSSERNVKAINLHYY